MSSPEDGSPWQVLGVQPGASEEEVRRAYERLAAALAPGSLALYSLAELDEQREVQQQLRAAYLTLMRAFGWEVPALPELERPAPEPAEAATAPPEPPQPAAPVPPPTPTRQAAPEVSPQTEFSGATLRRVREGLGLTVAELAGRTRIRPRQIESIEDEAFAALPQRVFVRGFVMAVARELRLDPERVWASYAKRWEATASR